MFLTIGMIIVGLFGGLMYVFPNTVWNIPSVLYVKDKEYRVAINRFLGKNSFGISAVFLLYLIFSFFFQRSLEPLVFVLFWAVLYEPFIAVLLFELNWYKKKKNKQHFRYMLTIISLGLLIITGILFYIYGRI